MLHAALLVLFLLQDKPNDIELGLREALDPAVYGIKVEFPDGWEPATEENLQYRLSYVPKGIDEKKYCRLLFSRLKETKEPRTRPAWNIITDELVSGFSQAFPGGVVEEEPQMVKLAGRDAMELRMDCKEADGSPMKAITIAFFHKDNIWRLDLVTTPEIFDEYFGTYETVRDKIELKDGLPTYLWGIVGLAAGLALVILLRMRKKPEDA